MLEKPKKHAGHGAFRAKNKQAYTKMVPEDFFKTGRGFGNRALAKKFGVNKTALIGWRKQVQAAVSEFGPIEKIMQNSKEITPLYYTTNIHTFCKLFGISKQAARGIILVLKSKGVIKEGSREDAIREYVKRKPNTTPDELVKIFGLQRPTAEQYVRELWNGAILNFIAQHPEANPRQIAEKFKIQLGRANSIIGWVRKRQKKEVDSNANS